MASRRTDRTRARRRRSPGRRPPSRIPSLVELRLPLPANATPLARVPGLEGVEVRRLECRLTGTRHRRLVRWLDLRLPDGKAASVLRALRPRGEPDSVAAVALGRDRLLVRLVEPAPAACAAAIESGALCTACPALDTGGGRSWRLVAPRTPAARQLLQAIRPRSGTSVAVGPPRPDRAEAKLSWRQERALATAYALGFFDYPRRTELGAVARQLGIGRSATLERLRRATAELARARYDRGAADGA